MSAIPETETFDDLLDEDEEVEDLTVDDAFPPPHGSSTMASGGADKEARFLVVDSIVHKVSYTKEGKVTKPRVEAIVRSHNALILAHPSEAEKWGRTKLTKQNAKHDTNAMLFIAAHTMKETHVHFNAQIHAWVEEHYKHMAQINWLRNGASEPVNLREVLTAKEYDELIVSAERYGSATNAITNAFKTRTCSRIKSRSTSCSRHLKGVP